MSELRLWSLIDSTLSTEESANSTIFLLRFSGYYAYVLLDDVALTTEPETISRAILIPP